MAPVHEPVELLEAFSRVADGVFAVDREMRVVYWNWAAERIFEVDAAGALGLRCSDIVAGYESTGAMLCAADCRVLECARRGHAVETYDLFRTSATGQRQWLNVSIVVLRGRRRASTLTVHVVRDVTAQRRLERQAERVLSAIGAPDDESSGGVAITGREAEVLRLLACGATNVKIAEAMGISATTVRNHIEHLLGKLRVHTKLEAVVYAASHGML